MRVVFTDRELDLMTILWQHGPSTVAEIRGRLSDSVSHNTVATILTILENKGHVAHVEEGRAFRYHALVGREEAGKRAFTRLVDTVFAGSPEALLTHFVRDRRLSADELRRIRAIVNEQIEQTDAKATPRRRKR